MTGVAAISFLFPSGKIKQANENAGEQRSAPGVSKKLGRSGEGVGEKESPAVSFKHFTELRSPANGEK